MSSFDDIRNQAEQKNSHKSVKGAIKIVFCSYTNLSEEFLRFGRIQVMELLKR